jgi:hypothetical protein
LGTTLTAGAPQGTSINRDLDQFLSYRYPVTARLVPLGATIDKQIDLTEGLTSFRILRDYDMHVMPYYSLEFIVSADNLRLIQQAWRTAKLYVTVGRSTLPVGSGSSQEVDTGTPYMKDVEFQVMTMPSSPSAVPTGQISDQARSTMRLGVKMELALTSALAINKKLNNGAFHGATSTDVVAHLANLNKPTTAGYKFVMAPHDNPTRHESIILPPMSFANSVRYIDNIHGMYGGETHVFHDHDHTLITSSAKTIAPKAGEAQRVVIEVGNSASNTPEQTTGSGYDPKSRTVRLRTSQQVGVNLQGPVHQEIHGESVKLVGSNLREQTGSDCQMLTPSGAPLSPGAPKEKIVYQGYDNKMLPQKMATRARERYAPANVTFEDADLNAFDPKLPWTLQAGDGAQVEAQGNWRLSGTEMVLRRSPNAVGSCSASVMARIKPAADGTGPASN